MHPYGTDSNERFWVFLSLIPLSFFLASRLQWLLDRFDVAWSQEWEFLADPTSAMFCFGVLYYIFNRWLWRLPILRWLDLVKIPDLNGTWDGYLKSSWNNHQTPFDATLTIEQTWTSVRVRQRRQGSSSSYSEAGTFLVNAGEGKRLSYEYRNDPVPGQVDTMASHRGTAVLVLEETTPRKLEGTYYTSHGRKNTGSMHFWQDSRPSDAERETPQLSVPLLG